MEYCSECIKDVNTETIISTDKKFEMTLCIICGKIIRHKNLLPSKTINRKISSPVKINKTVIKEQLTIEIPKAKKIDIPVNIIYHEKWEETLSKMKDKSIDYVFTSPPYNFFNTISDKKGKSKMYKNYDSTKEDKLSQQKYYEWQVALITELLRVTKNHIFYNNQILTNNKIALLCLMEYFKYQNKEVLFWDKRTVAPATLEGTFDSRVELILVFSNKTPLDRNFKDGNWHGTESNLVSLNRDRNKLTYLNKAVFPINLPRKFMLLFGNEGDIWYDPFGGTGTTAVAATLAKRNYILSEMDGEQVKEAKKRVLQYKNQTVLELES